MEEKQRQEEKQNMEEMQRQEEQQKLVEKQRQEETQRLEDTQRLEKHKWKKHKMDHFTEGQLLAQDAEKSRLQELEFSIKWKKQQQLAQAEEKMRQDKLRYDAKIDHARQVAVDMRSTRQQEWDQQVEKLRFQQKAFSEECAKKRQAKELLNRLKAAEDLSFEIHQRSIEMEENLFMSMEDMSSHTHSLQYSKLCDTQRLAKELYDQDRSAILAEDKIASATAKMTRNIEFENRIRAYAQVRLSRFEEYRKATQNINRQPKWKAKARASFAVSKKETDLIEIRVNLYLRRKAEIEELDEMVAEAILKHEREDLEPWEQEQMCTEDESSRKWLKSSSPSNCDAAGAASPIPRESSIGTSNCETVDANITSHFVKRKRSKLLEKLFEDSDDQNYSTGLETASVITTTT